MGDDVLFGDPLLAAAYKVKIKGLGVSFSLLKTHESTLLLEFAKRLFYRGVEITPFPMPAVAMVRKFYELVPVLYAETGRGWDFAKGVSQAIASFYQQVLGFNAKFCKEIKAKSVVVESLMLTMRGAQTAKDCLNAVYSAEGRPIPKSLTEQRCASLISQAAMESFQKSILDFSGNPENPRQFGKIAEGLGLSLVSSDEDTVVA